MATIRIDLGDRDTKRWMTCLICLFKEIEKIEAYKEVLNKFSAEVILRDDLQPSLGLLFPEGYPVPQELI